MIVRRAVSLGAVVLLGAACLVPTAQAVPQQPESVIVVLRDQHASMPATPARTQARTAATDADQAPLLDRARRAGATDVRSLHVVNAVALKASPAEVARLAADPAVARVLPDRQVALPRRQAEAPASATRGTSSAAVCPADPAKPLLEPEALQLTHTAYAAPGKASAQQLATGAGVRVAFLADGLDVDNPDFVRADGSKVFVDYRDFSGDGPLAPTPAAEAFGDASSIAAQGRQTYDLATVVNPAHPLPPGCTIQVRGMAPGASLVGLKVFPAGGFAFNSAILAALDWAVTVDHVDVVNESFGSNQFPDTNDDPTALFNEQLVAAGVTVVASSGDAGGENTIGSPASTPGVIAVGATQSLRLYAQTQAYGFPLSNGRYRSGNISGLSSSGITQPGRTLDLVAPGDLGWALCTPDPDLWQECTDDKGDPTPLLEFGGTSQSSPFVAGAAALVIQAYRDTHHGDSPSPALVKRLLTGTATDLGLPAAEQGAGLLDARRAVVAARSVDEQGARRSGSGLVTSPTQVHAEVRSGKTTRTAVRVTNTGRKAVVLHPSLRSETHVNRRDDFSLTLSATDQQFVDSAGVARTYTTQTFTVPKRTSHLTAAIAWSDPAATVRVTLLEPDGTYSSFSQPQGSGDFGLADVASPKAGRWTAVVWTAASAAGFRGPVQLTTTAFRSTTVGTVTPSRVTVPAGATRRLSVRVPAGDVGDAADALQLDTVGSHQAGAVPVVVRTLAATGARGGTFSGTFSGGNGRAGIPSPARTYDFDVPSGRPDLAVSLTVRGDPRQVVYGFLVDPAGEPVSELTNQRTGPDGSTAVTSSIQFDHRAPQPGRWRLVFTVFGPVAGTSTSTPYTGEVSYGLARVSASGVPTSATTVLAQGAAVHAKVLVTNRGAADSQLFVDARTTTRSDQALVGRNAQGYVLDPAPLPPFPAFTVPTETDALTVRATSDHPLLFEVSPFPADHLADLAFEGDPDRVAGPVGTSPSVTVADPVVAAQTWLALPSIIGPFAAQAPKTTTSYTGSAHTAGFDAAVTSSTGDPVLAAVQDPAPKATPLALDPGAAGTVDVTITPQGTVGSVVSGVLYLDTVDPVTGSFDEVAAVPYTYTVGAPGSAADQVTTTGGSDHPVGTTH